MPSHARLQRGHFVFKLSKAHSLCSNTPRAGGSPIITVLLATLLYLDHGCSASTCGLPGFGNIHCWTLRLAATAAREAVPSSATTTAAASTAAHRRRAPPPASGHASFPLPDMSALWIQAPAVGWLGSQAGTVGGTPA